MVHTFTIQKKLNIKEYNRIFDIVRDKGAIYKVQDLQGDIYRSDIFKDRGLVFYFIKNTYAKLLDIRVNPVKLLERDLLDLVTIDDIKEIDERFNNIIAKIDDSLKNIFLYEVKRIDYTINIKTKYTSEYIKLFQRADKPQNFKELYNYKSHRRGQFKGSMYYTSKSVNINFYDKSKERDDKGLYSEDDILRLEIQCKRLKTNSIKKSEQFDYKYLFWYFQYEMSDKYITNYYNKTVGKGDYYTLEKAIKLINKSNHTNALKEKLITLLTVVNRFRSVWKARESGVFDKVTFNRLKNILQNKLNINIVTIPVSLKVSYLPNILYSYSEDHNIKQ